MIRKKKCKNYKSHYGFCNAHLEFLQVFLKFLHFEKYDESKIQIMRNLDETINFEYKHSLKVDKEKAEKIENMGNIEIFYNERNVKISELTDEEKIDCISKLWNYKETIEGENENLKEMIQKMYFFGKMDKVQEESD